MQGARDVDELRFARALEGLAHQPTIRPPVVQQPAPGLGGAHDGHPFEATSRIVPATRREAASTSLRLVSGRSAPVVAPWSAPARPIDRAAGFRRSGAPARS